MSTHVSKVCNKAFRGLYFIRKFRKYLSGDATKVLVHAFVTSLLDYCNSVPCSLAFQNTNMIGCRGFLAYLPALSASNPSSVTTHQPFTIYIGYHCPTGFNLKYCYQQIRRVIPLSAVFFVGFFRFCFVLFFFFFAVHCRD